MIKPTDAALAVPADVLGTLTENRRHIVLTWAAAAGATTYEIVGQNDDSGLFIRRAVAAPATGYIHDIDEGQTGAFVYELRACTATACSAPVVVTVRL